jgi:hypothetical protein
MRINNINIAMRTIELVAAYLPTINELAIFVGCFTLDTDVYWNQISPLLLIERTTGPKELSNKSHIIKTASEGI